MLNAARDGILSLLVCRTILALLSSLHAFGLAGGLLSLLTLLVGLLGGSLSRFLLLRLARLLAAELLAPLLLLLGLDLRK